MVEKLLTALQVARYATPGLYPDGGGLYLQVTLGRDGSPNKSWLWRFSLRGRARHMGLGSAEYVSLADARAARDKARAKVMAGVDPITDRQAVTVVGTTVMTFDQCAAAYIKVHEAAWRNDKHRRQWTTTLASYVSPVFGSTSVEVIDTNLVMRCLESIWKSKPETASRIRGRIESVLAWATVRGFRQGANPAQWRNHLDQLLPAAHKVRPVRHMTALPYAEVPALMARLTALDTPAAKALRFTVLTAARSGEVVGATWSEIDLVSAVWTIPAARMKAGREHRVPLSEPALAILGVIAERTGIIFPGDHAAKLAVVRLWGALRNAGGTGTVHGLRSSFRDWVGDTTDFPREIAEAALAHTVGGVEGAYRRGDALEKRRALMEAWAEFVGGTKKLPG